MEWEFQDGLPIWQQLYETLRREISTGGYAPGSKMPAVRELAAQAGVNPNTMQRALSQLESDGLLITNRTAGRTVTEDSQTLQQVRRENWPSARYKLICSKWPCWATPPGRPPSC